MRWLGPADSLSNCVGGMLEYWLVYSLALLVALAPLVAAFFLSLFRIRLWILIFLFLIISVAYGVFAIEMTCRNPGVDYACVFTGRNALGVRPRGAALAGVFAAGYFTGSLLVLGVVRFITILARRGR